MESPKYAILPFTSLSHPIIPAKGINLEYFHFPYSIQKIGEGAFKNCAKFGLLAISPIYKNIKEIGRYAFNNCDIRSIAINNSIEKIGKNAFSSDVSLRFFGTAKFKDVETEKVFDTSNIEDRKIMLQYDCIKI